MNQILYDFNVELTGHEITNLCCLFSYHPFCFRDEFAENKFGRILCPNLVHERESLGETQHWDHIG